MTDHFFQLLGLPLQYDINPEDLSSRYRSLSQVLHPDRQGTQLDAAQRTSMLLKAAALNQAYRTLQDPEKRAAHLLECLVGPDVFQTHARSPSPAFLADMLDWQEACEQAQSSDDPKKSKQLWEDVQKEIAQGRQQLQQLFASKTDNLNELAPEVIDCLQRLRYHHRLIESIERSQEDR